MILNLVASVLNAINGVNLWKRLSKGYVLSESIFILIYPGEEYLCEQIKRYIYRYMGEKNVYRILIITESPQHFQDLCSYFENTENINIKLLKHKQVKKLISFYNFNGVSDRFMIFSIKNLYGRNISYLNCKNNVSNNDLVEYALLTLKEIDE